ncbi:MAG: UDP-N-acetylglucosamine 1-carboxyvinyltransferase [Candidatus Harrisonbacteria bacterium]|nr:UDP-N-acetylglucosamine 1-carboxyvinyltransferase [Candidatus Harrisonbacteria bacterium]
MQFLINGGKKLKGEITLSGAKNAASKMLIASLLTGEECVFSNVPDIGEVDIAFELCRVIGSDIARDGRTVRIKTPQIKNFRVESLSRRNRLPILALGPLLARVHEVEVPFLGGDKIGARPVDIHLEALRAMGATIEAADERYVATAKNGLHGTKIRLRYPSVGATENIILAAVLAEGRTTLYNAAREPEVKELVKMLQKMGAIIELGANRAFHIDGVKKLRGVSHAVIPDRNEAVSFACLAVATDGDVFVRGAVQDHMSTFLSTLRRIGGEYEVKDGGIRFWRSGELKAAEIETDPHPGFMTDWQQPFAVLLTQAKGASIIHETVYDDRFGYTADLNAMGADITVFSKCLGELTCRFNGKGFNHSAVINGPTPLHGANLTVRDLRSGIAHIIAALTASGESVISGIEEIDRGYERVEERLQKLGADIVRQH